ncbi:MAG: NigD-like N-terminal domain-containing protein [Prolixibacteraceae bacterium]|nr:NigD-like N-terminal domain-containing protein [Prolixibacteraceae bacterium]
MNRIYLLLAFVMVIGFYACDNNDEYYSLGDIWLSMGFINVPDSGNNSFFIVADNGDTLLPLANDVPYFEIEDQQRVIVNYTILADADTLKNKFWVKINNLQDVLFKEIVELTAENNDSLGHDPINIEDVWLSKNILNFELGFYGGGKTHWVNLVYDNEQFSGNISPLKLELRHNALQDSLPYYLRAVVSFNLSKLAEYSNDSINFSINYTNLQNQEKTLFGTMSK